MYRQITETSALLWMYLEKFKIKTMTSVIHNVEVIFQIRKLRVRTTVNYKERYMIKKYIH